MRQKRDHGRVRRLPPVLSIMVAAMLPGLAQAATINFDTLPNLPTQPSTFAAAGPMQTFTQPGLFSVTGGVVLGNPTFLAAFPATGSAPNLYGTTNIADPSLLDTITFTFPAAAQVTSLSGIVFNGLTTPETYVITVRSPTNAPVAQFTFPAVPPNSNSLGLAQFGVFGPSIGSVTITSPDAGTNGWDFFVDDLVLTQAVPEPGALFLLTTGVVVVWVRARRRG